jgi:hypothetical protein
MIKSILYFLFLYPILGFIIKPFIFNKKIKTEITKNINYNIEYENIIKRLDGFFGTIGPNIYSTKTLYKLFMGDGVINGIFISNGKITFIKRFIKTNKFIHNEIKSSLHP